MTKIKWTTTTVGRIVLLILITVVSGLVMGQGCLPADNGDGGDNQTTGQYLGAADCRLCHSRHYDNWLVTRHAGALGTLKAIGQGTNAACLACHTVGFGEDGGFVDETKTPQLAGVQCESCHGAGLNHRSNVDDANARPLKSIAAGRCGKCHNGTHHPTFDEWSASGHAKVTEDVAASFTAGRSLNSCGICHSGDLRDLKLVQGLTVGDDYLAGKTAEEMNGVVCVTCHDPHKRTGNTAAQAGEGEDFQLRFPEVATPPFSNTIADITNSDRYNLCGQCHRSREATWKSTSRPPHHSVQVNMYLGEMPVPDGTGPLLDNQRSTHRFVAKQCVTCHMPTKEFESEENVADSGHHFAVEMTNCSVGDCHPSQELAQQDMDLLQAKVEADLNALEARLGDPATWQYSASPYNGPADQSQVSDAIKQIRYLLYYVRNDGSMGVHNPGYTKTILKEVDFRLKALGK